MKSKTQTFLNPLGHLGVKPVIFLLVLPLTQVIVFFVAITFLVSAIACVVADGVGLGVAIGVGSAA